MQDYVSQYITCTALRDKILVGYTGKAYGYMMGEPIEYRAQGATSSIDMEFVELCKALDPALHWHLCLHAGQSAFILLHDRHLYRRPVCPQLRYVYRSPVGNCLQSTAVWLTGLDEGQHMLRVATSTEKNVASGSTEIALERVASYRGEVASLPERR